MENEVIEKPRTGKPGEVPDVLGGLDVGSRRLGIADNMAVRYNDACCRGWSEDVSNCGDDAINARLITLRLDKGGQTATLVQTRYGKTLVTPVFQKRREQFYQRVLGP